MSLTGASYISPTDQIVVPPGQNLGAPDNAAGLLSSTIDLVEALGAGAAPKIIGGFANAVGVAANSFNLGAAGTDMYQQGPTFQNTSKAATSTFNLVLIGVGIAQPEMAPGIGLIFAGEAVYELLKED